MFVISSLVVILVSFPSTSACEVDRTITVKLHEVVNQVIHTYSAATRSKISTDGLPHGFSYNKEDGAVKVTDFVTGDEFFLNLKCTESGKAHLFILTVKRYKPPTITTPTTIMPTSTPVSTTPPTTVTTLINSTQTDPSTPTDGQESTSSTMTETTPTTTTSVRHHAIDTDSATGGGRERTYTTSLPSTQPLSTTTVDKLKKYPHRYRLKDTIIYIVLGLAVFVLILVAGLLIIKYYSIIRDTAKTIIRRRKSEIHDNFIDNDDRDDNGVDGEHAYQNQTVANSPQVASVASRSDFGTSASAIGAQAGICKNTNRSLGAFGPQPAVDVRTPSESPPPSYAHAVQAGMSTEPTSLPPIQQPNDFGCDNLRYNTYGALTTDDRQPTARDNRAASTGSIALNVLEWRGDTKHVV